MNSLAQHALERAMQRPVSGIQPVVAVQKAVPARAKVLAAVADKPARPARLDQYGFREGREHALVAIKVMPALLSNATGLNELIQILKRSAAGRPASQALGIWSIIELLEAA